MLKEKAGFTEYPLGKGVQTFSKEHLNVYTENDNSLNSEHLVK